jgi:hypothetical protein
VVLSDEAKEGVMQQGYQPEAEIVKVAEGGIAGMVGAISGEKVSPDMMIDAVMHIVATWVASSQTKSSASQCEEEVEELVEMLPWYIEYHRTAGWLPEPHRGDH